MLRGLLVSMLPVSEQQGFAAAFLELGEQRGQAVILLDIAGKVLHCHPLQFHRLNVDIVNGVSHILDR